MIKAKGKKLKKKKIKAKGKKLKKKKIKALVIILYVNPLKMLNSIPLLRMFAANLKPSDTYLAK